jgi:hypothetical protein
MDAYSEGNTHAIMNENDCSIDDNPYSVGTENYKDWREGYLDGEASCKKPGGPFGYLMED